MSLHLVQTTALWNQTVIPVTVSIVTLLHSVNTLTHVQYSVENRIQFLAV